MPLPRNSQSLPAVSWKRRLQITYKEPLRNNMAILSPFRYAGQGWPSVASAMDGVGATGSLCRPGQSNDHIIIFTAA